MPPKPPPTHFLCLPLVTSISRPQLQISLSKFAADTLKPDENGRSKIPPRALRPVGAIHFTIGVMSLQTPERIEEACNLLKSLDILEMLRAAAPSSTVTSTSPSKRSTPCQSIEPPLSSPLPAESLSPQPLTIALTNLTPMQYPASTSSLYASPNPPSPILPFAQRLHDAFLAAGLLLPPPSNRPLRLHATLVNTIYVKKAASGKNRWAGGSGKIDAREVIEKWGEITWAEDVRVEKVAICEMGAKKVWAGEEGEEKVVDEIYKEVGWAELP